MRRGMRHVGAFLLFALLTGAWLSPVWRSASAAIPGTTAGDNITFLWNGWWMGQALSAHVSPLRTSMLFAPWGADLTLNTHTALPALAAALFSRYVSVTAAMNLVVALHLLLNFVLAYTLAWRLTRQAGAALLAGLIFGWSPYLGSHLAGHFNLIAAWVLPLVALLLIGAVETKSVARAALLGIAVGGTVFIDYYYTVYAVMLLACLALSRSLRLTCADRPRRRWQIVSLRAIAAVAVVVLLLIAFIAVTGGMEATFAGVRLSMRGTGNLVVAAGLLAFVTAGIAWLPRVRVRVARQVLSADAWPLAVAGAVAALVASPILLSLFQLWQHGDYVTQRYLWRSAPRGVDVATLVLGNPGGLLWRGLPSRVYAALQIDPIEQVAWFGPAVTALCAAANLWGKSVPSWPGPAAASAYDSGPVTGSHSSVPTCRRKASFGGQTPSSPEHGRPGVRPQPEHWIAVAGVFGAWALGPYLVAFGRNLPVLLPATLVRFVPFAANARIPSRAIVVVYLVAAVLGAYGFAALRERRRSGLAWLLFAAVVLDYVPAPTRVVLLDHPAIYDALRQAAAPGAVCELPIGLRDGFGERGRFDVRVLFYQTLHGRAISGGSLARLSPRTVGAYEGDPILGPLLRLSEGRPLPGDRALDPATTTDTMIRHGFRFVVVNRTLVSADLLDFVRQTLRVRELASEDDRVLYEIVAPRD